MRKIYIIALFIALVLSSACTKETPIDNTGFDLESGTTISFTNNTQSSRGVVQTLYTMNSFSVFAYNTQDVEWDNLTNTSSVVQYINNIEVSRDNDNRWTYAPLKSWLSNTNYNLSFFAFSPKNEITNTFESVTNTTTYNYTVKSSPRDQKDLLFAKALDRKKPTEAEIAAGTDSIHFAFDHVLSQIKVEVKPIHNYEYKITSVVFNDLKYKGSFNENTKTWSPDAETKDSYFTIANGSLKDLLVDGSANRPFSIFDRADALFVMPQTLTAANTLTVRGEMKKWGVPFEYTVDLSTLTAQWEVGKAYKYTISIDPEGLDLNFELIEWDEKTVAGDISDDATYFNVDMGSRLFKSSESSVKIYYKTDGGAVTVDSYKYADRGSVVVNGDYIVYTPSQFKPNRVTLKTGRIKTDVYFIPDNLDHYPLGAYYYKDETYSRNYEFSDVIGVVVDVDANNKPSRIMAVDYREEQGFLMDFCDVATVGQHNNVPKISNSKGNDGWENTLHIEDAVNNSYEGTTILGVYIPGYRNSFLGKDDWEYIDHNETAYPGDWYIGSKEELHRIRDNVRSLIDPTIINDRLDLLEFKKIRTDIHYWTSNLFEYKFRDGSGVADCWYIFWAVDFRNLDAPVPMEGARPGDDIELHIRCIRKVPL